MYECNLSLTKIYIKKNYLQSIRSNSFFIETIILYPDKAPISINPTTYGRKATSEKGLHMVEAFFTFITGKISHALRKHMESVRSLTHFFKRKLIALYIFFHARHYLPICIHVHWCVVCFRMAAWARYHVQTWVCMSYLNWKVDDEEDQTQKIGSHAWEKRVAAMGFWVLIIVNFVVMVFFFWYFGFFFTIVSMVIPVVLNLCGFVREGVGKKIKLTNI